VREVTVYQVGVLSCSAITITIPIMSNTVPESAIEDSPPPQSQAGPSTQRNRIEESFRDFDLDSFDWNAYEGTYKG
jgi:hypothetical protein